MAWQWYDSKVIKIKDESATTKRFWVEISAEETFDFKAGQFVTMDLPIHEKRLKRWRSYSIANPPDGSNILEFCIVKMEGGAATKYFFEEVTVGTPIRFKGPDGGFVLPADIDKDIVMVCTGTGVAPFRSMLHDIFNHKKEHQNIHLIFGTRWDEGILYKAEFQEMAEKFPEFKYSVALSREKIREEDKVLDIQSGYVHQFYGNAYQEVKPDITFYLCGWSAMIDDAVAKLIVEMGYDKQQIYYELYG